MVVMRASVAQVAFLLSLLLLAAVWGCPCRYNRDRCLFLIAADDGVAAPTVCSWAS